MKLKILITGVNGFVGSSMAKYFENQDLFLLARKFDKNPKGKRIIQDLKEKLDTSKLPENIDIIIHEAARAGRDVPSGDKEAWKINVEATKQLIEYAVKSGAKKFVFASTSAVYPSAEEAVSEETKPEPQNYYAETKLAAEEEIKKFESNLDYLIFRYFYPYGPGQNRGIHKVVDRVLKGEEIVVYNKGDNPKTNPIYIDDVNTLTKKSFDIKGSHIINMGGIEIVKIKEIADWVGEMIGKRPKYKFVNDKNKKNEIGDVEKMKKLLGIPKVKIRRGLEKTIRSFV